MVKKSFIVAVLLFIFYSIFVAVVIPGRSASQHQWQDNIIKAQKFIYNDTAYYNAVVIGSSLSCRLVMDSLPQTYNLSFGGQSIYDGLNILSHMDKLPGNIFIEMNFALRNESRDFTAALNSPLLYYPKKLFLSLREDKQPLVLLGTLLNNKFESFVLPRLKPLPHTTEKKASGTNQEMFTTMLQLQVADYSMLRDEAYINDCFDRLGKSVSRLEKRGVNIVFFEMPVNKELNNLPKATSIRSRFYQQFPVTKYSYIPIPAGMEYKTTDGLHLSKEEALAYTLHLRSKMKAFLQ